MHRARSYLARVAVAPGLITLLCLAWPGLITSTFAQPVKPVNVVDVLVAYTPQARNGAGGTAAILANIDLAMLDANTVLQNSGVHARLRLVKAAEVAYTESGSVAGDLTHLQNPGDPVLGRVSRLREEYSADLVCMVTETGGDWDLYGLQGPSSENAFSIIRRPFLTGLNYFPVVLSFNFGCQLERPYAFTAPWRRSPASGWPFSPTRASFTKAWRQAFPKAGPTRLTTCWCSTTLRRLWRLSAAEPP
jgi:hypothetical protein